MRSLIAELRDLAPLKPLTPAHALHLAERQANKLLELTSVQKPPFPEAVIRDLPRVQVERLALGPVSGATEWSHGRWLILLNSNDPPGRQRFSLAHEFKHVLDNPFVELLYPAENDNYDRRRAEQLCDYFAACLLMPRPWVEASWTLGPRDTRLMARRFEVSTTAMTVRLQAIGLIASARRDRHRPAFLPPRH